MEEAQQDSPFRDQVAGLVYSVSKHCRQGRGVAGGGVDHVSVEIHLSAGQARDLALAIDTAAQAGATGRTQTRRVKRRSYTLKATAPCGSNSNAPVKRDKQWVLGYEKEYSVSDDPLAVSGAGNSFEQPPAVSGAGNSFEQPPAVSGAGNSFEQPPAVSGAGNSFEQPPAVTGAGNSFEQWSLPFCFLVDVDNSETPADGSRARGVVEEGDDKSRSHAETIKVNGRVFLRRAAQLPICNNTTKGKGTQPSLCVVQGESQFLTGWEFAPEDGTACRLFFGQSASSGGFVVSASMRTASAQFDNEAALTEVLLLLRTIFSQNVQLCWEGRP